VQESTETINSAESALVFQKQKSQPVSDDVTVVMIQT
jgi:hypothetical protein